MNRFSSYGESKLHPFPKNCFLFVLCPVLLIVFWLSISSIGDNTVAQQQTSLETALNRDVTHCYAVEGFYPPSLEYLEEHYGFTYDKDLFFIDYQPIGSNLRPDITIIVTR